MSSYERSESTHVYARAVAEQLGEGWAYVDNRNSDGERPWYAQIRRPDGAGLHVSLTDAHKKDGGRYVWRVDYPRDTTGYEHGPAYGEDRASITTACTKTPAQCAADIARRLLPVYLPQYARSLERVASANAYTNETQANLATLAALVGGRVNIGSRDTVWVPGSTIYRLSVSGDSVTLDLRLTMAQAVAVLQLVKEEVTPDE